MDAFLNDRRLSFKARGLLAFIEQQGYGWKFDVENLIEASNEDGRESVRSGMQELLRYGYATLETVRNGAGQLCGKHYQLSAYAGMSSTNRTDMPMGGYVYVVQGGQYHKIGCTKNFKARMKSLSVGAPFPLVRVLLITTNDMIGT